MNFVPPNMGFDADAFRRVFAAQPEEVQRAMKQKAIWENMTLSAVMKDYYPELWKQVSL